jgi:flavorubredoxin
MKTQAITDYIHCIHLDIQTTDLFEGIWPIPQGVSLNCYLVKGEKTAFIDLFKDWNGAAKEAEETLAATGMGFSEIDYLILNHLEPDHTGWLREFREKNPKAEIISTAKGIELVKSFYKIDTGLRAVKDGDTLDLGAGKVLKFFEAPNVHWPETMITWEPQSGVLFSCDAFGSFGALGEKVFDDEYSQEEHAFFESETLRYYANIVSSFSVFVERAIQKISTLDIRCVAPSHGIVWRKKPEVIIRRYSRYASYAKGETEKEIAVIWGSMYGNTKAGVDAVIRGIEAEGVPYTCRRVPDENVSWVLTDAYKSSALVLAMPTYEYAMFPPMAYILDIFRRKHIFGKKVLRIGSWGWAGGAKKDYEAVITSLKWESLESVEWPGYPDSATLALLEEQGRKLALAVKEVR